MVIIPPGLEADNILNLGREITQPLNKEAIEADLNVNDKNVVEDALPELEKIMNDVSPIIN